MPFYLFIVIVLPPLSLDFWAASINLKMAMVSSEFIGGWPVSKNLTISVKRGLYNDPLPGTTGFTPFS